jgi:hypothetical protein
VATSTRRVPQSTVMCPVNSVQCVLA